jgi:hypothetical protein
MDGNEFQRGEGSGDEIISYLRPVFVFGPWLPKGVTGFFFAQTVAGIGFHGFRSSQKGTTFASCF